MNWNVHYVKQDHAFLGASKFHWIRYNDEQLKQSWRSFRAAQIGTELHEYARMAIKNGIWQRDAGDTLSMYINDAIGFKMTPEVLLYYSDNCFGTADSICFDEEKKLLRIHDLKTGVTKAHMEQLLIYAALFCLDYKIKPAEIKIELRIYQNDDKVVYEPSADEIAHIMSRIISADKIINTMKMLEG